MNQCAGCGSPITLGASDCARCGKPIASETTSPRPEDTLDPTDGLLGNLWSGNYTLVKTYWLFGFLGGFAVAAIFYVTILVTRSPSIALVCLLAIWGWQIFISVAIWRSAGKYPGAKIWQLLARFAVILGLVQLLLASVEFLGLIGGA